VNTKVSWFRGQRFFATTTTETKEKVPDAEIVSGLSHKSLTILAIKQKVIQYNLFNIRRFTRGF